MSALLLDAGSPTFPAVPPDRAALSATSLASAGSYRENTSSAVCLKDAAMQIVQTVSLQTSAAGPIHCWYKTCFVLLTENSLSEVPELPIRDTLLLNIVSRGGRALVQNITELNKS